MSDEQDDEEEAWCSDQRADVEQYLKKEGVAHGQIGDWPAWHITGCVALWAVESDVRPEWIGWWVISGDLPTDYCASSEVAPPQHPRTALKVFAERWLSYCDGVRAGKTPATYKVGGVSTDPELLPMLESRAQTLIKWWADDTMWDI
jgi:hypothetical protein